jgi:hypothetical protein
MALTRRISRWRERAGAERAGRSGAGGWSALLLIAAALNVCRITQSWRSQSAADKPPSRCNA